MKEERMPLVLWLFTMLVSLSLSVQMKYVITNECFKTIIMYDYNINSNKKKKKSTNLQHLEYKINKSLFVPVHWHQCR